MQLFSKAFTAMAASAECRHHLSSCCVWQLQLSRMLSTLCKVRFTVHSVYLTAWGYWK